MASSSSQQLRLKKDLEALLSDVKSELDNAETNAVQSNSDKLHIKELREIVYDAEDALQDCQTKELQDKIEVGRTSLCGTCRNKKRPLEVRDGIPSPPPSPIPCLSCTEAKLSELKKDAGSVRQRASLGLEKSSRNLIRSVAARRPPTGSMITQNNLYSMVELKNTLVDLFSKDIEKYIHDDFKGASCKKLTILPIVGTAGCGKTTLAQHVYKDARDKESSKTRGPEDQESLMTGWVCASDYLDENPLEIMRSVLESIDRTAHSRKFTQLSTVHHLLKEKLNEKKLLLVVDDARNIFPNFWSKLCAPMAEAVAEGSIIIITTSEYEVINAMPSHIQRTENCYPNLPSEDCMSLFESEIGGLGDEDLLAIGEKIVRKYEGIPRAIKDAAHILRSEKDPERWSEFLANASRDSYWVTSYCTLKPQSRRCFLYCALFPKGHLFTKNYLINLWMSEGLVKPEGNTRMEDIAVEYFTDLENKFVLRPHMDTPNEYDIPNPLHDLAETILDHNFCRLNDRDKKTQSEQKTHVRYASFIVHEREEEVNFEMPDPRLRTYVVINNTGGLVRLKLPNNAFTNLGYLRTLDLSYTNLVELPGSIGHLRSLHFLGLNGTLIKVLPDSLCTLYNLQILELNSCKKLQALPKSISKLVQLRHLSLDASLTFFCMPTGIGKLTNLQTLPIFNVGRRHDEDAGLQELGELENLRGKLFIRGLCDAEDLRSLILEKSKFIRHLTLCWSKDRSGSNMQANEEQLQRVFNCLKPHSNLQYLHVNFYDGKKLPEWMEDKSFKKLESILLRECKNCDTLPSLGVLPYLKRLAISNVGVTEIDKEFGTFPSLKDLTFEEMYNWTNWLGVGDNSFPRLTYLYLSSCPGLARVPVIKGLEILKMRNCRSVSEIPNLTSLDNLEIYNCEELMTIPSLTSLTELKMVNCGKLTSLPSFPSLKKLAIQNCMDLMKITLLPSLEELLVENCGRLAGLLYYPSLKNLELFNCTELTGIPSLPSLKSLKMDSCGKVERIPDFPCLEKLEIRGCKDLIEFSCLTPLRNSDSREVDKLHAVSVPRSLKILIPMSCTAPIKWDESKNGNSRKLKDVEFFGCVDFACIQKISSVTSLKLEKCKKIIDFSSFPFLQRLHVCDCDELLEVPTVKSLLSLTLMYCGRLKQICDQPRLQSLWVESCNQVEYIGRTEGEAGCCPLKIGKLPSLESLFIANSLVEKEQLQAWKRSQTFPRDAYTDDYTLTFTKDGKM